LHEVKSVIEDIKLILITLSEENIIQYQGSTIFIEPAWKWLLKVL